MMLHAPRAWWSETSLYAPIRIPSRRSVHFGILSGTTVFLRSRSVAPPSPRHHAFCFCLVRFPFCFFGMVVAGEVGFLQKRNWRNSSANSMDEVLQKLFSGGKDFAKLRLNLFLHLSARRKGSGEWMRAGNFWIFRRPNTWQKHIKYVILPQGIQVH